MCCKNLTQKYPLLSNCKIILPRTFEKQETTKKRQTFLSLSTVVFRERGQENESEEYQMTNLQSKLNWLWVTEKIQNLNILHKCGQIAYWNGNMEGTKFCFKWNIYLPNWPLCFTIKSKTSNLVKVLSTRLRRWYHGYIYRFL